MENKTESSEALEKEGVPKSDAKDIAKSIGRELAKYRKQFEKTVDEAEKAYYGDQHKTGKDRKTTHNRIFQIVQSILPIITDAQSGTQLISEIEERQEDADNLEKAIKYVYQDQNLQILLQSVLTPTLVKGAGWVYVYSDPNANDGDGQIRFKEIPWKDFFTDGNASLVDDATKAKIRIHLDKNELMRLFPEYKEEISELQGKMQLDGNEDNDAFESRDVSGRGDGSMTAPKQAAGKDLLEYCEIWTKDYSLTDIPDEETQEDLAKEKEALGNNLSPEIKKWENHNAHTQAHTAQRDELLAMVGLAPETSFEQAQQYVMQLVQENPAAQEQMQAGLLQLKLIDNHLEEHEHMLEINPTGQMPKYKNDWRVIRIIQDEVVVYDGEAPSGLDTVPIVPFYCYKDSTPYGFGEAKNILGPQRILNEMDNAEKAGLLRVTNPGWVADRESGVDAKKLTQEPGLVVIKAMGTEVRRLEPGQVSPQLGTRVQYEYQAINEISGVREPSQGAMPSPNASGVTVSKLQMQGEGRQRLKVRHLEQYSLRRLASITGQLIINTWSVEKKMRFKGNDGDISSFLYDPMKMQDLKYTIEISAGSMAGVDKDALLAFYMNLLQLGAINFKQFLSVAPFPGRETLQKSISEQDEQATQMQQVQDTQAQAQKQLLEMQKENIKLRAMISPDLLSAEERRVSEQMIRDEAMQKMVGSSVLSDAQQAAPSPV